MSSRMVRSGQTLLEVLIACAIITVGIISAVTLLIAIQTTSRVTYQEAIALELGREAIEAARFIRDSNWLERESGATTTNYADGLRDSTDPTDYTAIYRWRASATDPAAAITFDFSPDTLSDTSTTVYQQTAARFYRQTTSTPLPSGWEATPFQRFVTMYPICSSDAGVTEFFVTIDGQTCTSVFPGTVEIGVQIVVQLQWSDHGTTHSRTIEERLYNWKYPEDLS